MPAVDLAGGSDYFWAFRSAKDLRAATERGHAKLLELRPQIVAEAAAEPAPAVESSCPEKHRPPLDERRGIVRPGREAGGSANRHYLGANGVVTIHGALPRIATGFEQGTGALRTYSRKVYRVFPAGLSASLYCVGNALVTPGRSGAFREWSQEVEPRAETLVLKSRRCS